MITNSSCNSGMEYFLEFCNPIITLFLTNWSNSTLSGCGTFILLVIATTLILITKYHKKVSLK